VSGGEHEDAATEERISQILSEAQAAMQKKHSDEQVCIGWRSALCKAVLMLSLSVPIYACMYVFPQLGNGKFLPLRRMA